jgi:ferredoxin-NADP reductase
MQRKEFFLILKQSYLIAPGVLHLEFVCEDNQPFTFIPGQFITIHIPTPEKVLRRSYSIANSYHDGSATVEFAASYVKGGTASELLFNLQPGEKITASGPFGRLILRQEEPARYVLMATGTGVTPYRAMLVEIEKRLQLQPNLRIMVVFGVRNPADLLYGEEFVAFANKNPRFEFHAYYSRVKLENAQPHENEGYVGNILEKVAFNPTQDIFYLCGNPNMIDTVFAKLVEGGFATENIRREKYISSH